MEHGWSHAILVHQIETDLYRRSGQAFTNSTRTLPPPQSDLAQQILKDPYNFDFLTLGEDARERGLERGLLDHLRQFLLELGAGFSFVGSQYHLEVGGKDFYLSAVDDLLRHPTDQPTVGILLCKSKNQTVVEYALRDLAKPLGVADFQLRQALPDTLQSTLPTIAALEAELQQGDEPHL